TRPTGAPPTPSCSTSFPKRGADCRRLTLACQPRDRPPPKLHHGWPSVFARLRPCQRPKAARRLSGARSQRPVQSSRAKARRQMRQQEGSRTVSWRIFSAATSEPLPHQTSLKTRVSITTANLGQTYEDILVYQLRHQFG